MGILEIKIALGKGTILKSYDAISKIDNFYISKHRPVHDVIIFPFISPLLHMMYSIISRYELLRLVHLKFPKHHFSEGSVMYLNRGPVVGLSRIFHTP